MILKILAYASKEAKQFLAYLRQHFKKIRAWVVEYFDFYPYMDLEIIDLKRKKVTFDGISPTFLCPLNSYIHTVKEILAILWWKGISLQPLLLAGLWFRKASRIRIMVLWNLGILSFWHWWCICLGDLWEFLEQAFPE